MSTTTTQSDVVTAAMGLAKNVAEGRLAPADLERQAIAEMRYLFGEVVGQDHPAWEVQADVARQAIALGALTADELAEWAAVMRRRVRERPSAASPDEAVPESISIANKAHCHQYDSTKRGFDPDDDLADVPDDVVAEAEAAALAVANQHQESTPEPRPTLSVAKDASATATEQQGYDPLAHWPPSRTLLRPQ